MCIYVLQNILNRTLPQKRRQIIQKFKESKWKNIKIMFHFNESREEKNHKFVLLFFSKTEKVIFSELLCSPIFSFVSLTQKSLSVVFNFQKKS